MPFQACNETALLLPLPIKQKLVNCAFLVTLPFRKIFLIFQKDIYHISEINFSYFRKIFLIFQKDISHISERYFSYFRKIFFIFQKDISHISERYFSYFPHCLCTDISSQFQHEQFCNKCLLVFLISNKDA